MFSKSTKNPLVMIREMILDSSIDLADILRRAKVLASQLNNQEFKNWVHNELNGYSEGTDLPNYRLVLVPPLGTFSGTFGRMITNSILPTYNLSESLKKKAEKLPLPYSIRELEEMLNKEDGFRYTWPAEATILMRDKIRMSGGYVLTEVYQPIYSTTVTGVLDAVRNRLLDFVLEMEKLAPDITDSEHTYDELPPEKVTQIFNITIQGNHNILASGEAITQYTNQTISIKSQDDLSEYLKSLGIEKNDIEELLRIASKEKPSKKGGFGPNVSSWIGKMIAKAASGVWKISVDVAGGLLTKAISAYYGLD